MRNPITLPPMSPDELNAMTRADFHTFVIRCFMELNPSLKFLPNWHIEVLAAKLQDVRQGITRRLIINIPPRHLKSLAASIALPAWLLGHDPTLSIINATYGQELSDKFARDCRAIMSTAWYQAVFSTRLTSNRAALQELTTTKGGSRFSTSIGGVLTGRGADVIIIDDPLKPSDAMSESRRAAANDWYDGTLYSRLNDKEKGIILIVMQRLHEDDLVGHVQLSKGWDQVSFAAIAEVDETHEISTPFGNRTFSRKTGEALHPERESLDTLATIRSTMGTYNWAGQYQQSPAPTGDAMVKAIWFPRYVPGEQPGMFDRIVQSWDTANKPSELADYSVCTTWGIKGAHFYLLDVLRKKLSYPDLRRAVIDQSVFHQPKVILIEDKASGTQLIQDLIADGLRTVTRYVPSGDKVMRLNSQTATMEHGFVHLPTEASWLADYLHEMTIFPNGRHDDQVDSTAQMLDWCKIPIPGSGMLQYYREQAEAIGGVRSPATTTRLRAPAGISHVYGSWGRPYAVHEGHIDDVSPEDAGPFVAAGFRKLA
jgi:predicted phage terminase large subunit-like protein